jgi:hypothetical protein
VVFFDEKNGNQIEEVDPDGQATKTVYNGMNWVIDTYITDGGVVNNPTTAGTWSTAGSVSGDVVLSQEQDVYDGDGDVVESIDTDRVTTDATSATGAPGRQRAGWPRRVYGVLL